MNELPQALVKLFEAIAEREYSDFSDLFDPEVEYEIVGLETYRGEEGISNYFQMMAFLFTSASNEIHSVVRDSELESGRYAIERTETVVAGDQTVSTRNASCFTIVNGRIIRWADYLDFGALARALGH